VTLLRRLRKDEAGATLVEYAMALALLSMLMVVGFLQVTKQSNTAYNLQTTTMTGVQESPPPTTAP